jgi:hypothetical protein
MAQESMGHERRSFSHGPSLRVPSTVRLPAELGVALCLRHVWHQACAQAGLLVSAAYDLTPTPSTR